MAACRGEQAWQIVGPQTRLAVCRHLLEMEQGPGPSVGWLAVGQAGVCCQQVAVCTEAEPASLAKGSTLAGSTSSSVGGCGYLDYLSFPLRHWTGFPRVVLEQEFESGTLEAFSWWNLNVWKHKMRWHEVYPR